MSIEILLVDDHEIVRDGLGALIEKQLNMKVVGEARNGKEAVRLVHELKPDVVIMDISMPDLNGIEATRQIRESSPSTKVIALSVYSDKRYVEGMLSAGVSGYLVKSCAFDSLVQAVVAVMNGEAYLSPVITNVVMKEYTKKQTGDDNVFLSESNLSTREREVLQLIAEGCHSKQIADKLSISVKTVSSHRRSIMEKLNLNNVADLTKFALREGLASI